MTIFLFVCFYFYTFLWIPLFIAAHTCIVNKYYKAFEILHEIWLCIIVNLTTCFNR